MKPKAVVTSLPIKNITNSLEFYRTAFELELSEAEEGVITIELGNLSLFLININDFEAYSKKANLTAYLPDKSVQTILSCAIGSRNDIERYLQNIENTKGKIAKGLHKNEWGQELCYVQDPDGHLWELVYSPDSQQSSNS